jgi:crotonobetainyl-CoA:carnitine CoA-transferase CaiB-like acyl-CoA transferase
VIGILAALSRRKDTGQGARVDTSLLETGVAWMTNPVANYSATGKLPKRMGSATAMLAPYEVFETADAHVFIGCGADRMFQKMTAALGQAGMAQDERFRTNAARVANRDALHEELEAVTGAQTTAAVVETLRAAGVPVSAVNDLSRLLDDPQVRALGLHQRLPVESGAGTATQLAAVGTPIRFDGERSYNGHLSLAVGQDSQDVLATAGLSQQDIAALLAPSTKPKTP